jgi:hypothetical protein
MYCPSFPEAPMMQTLRASLGLRAVSMPFLLA